MSTFDSVNGVSDGADYVSPYYGTLDGNPISLYCNDFATTVYFGESWTANLTPLTSSDLSNTRYGNVPNAAVLYEEAAWLTTQFDSHPNDWVDLQHTIWQLFVPWAPAPSASNGWLSLAQQNYQSLDYSNFAILTNVGVHDPQAQQVQEYVVKVPEPDAILLLLVMMGGCLVLIRVFRVAR